MYRVFFLGVLQAIKAGRYENPFMATIEEDGEVLALFQMTPPHPLNFITANDNRLEECMDLVIRNLLELETEISSIISLKPWAYSFAKKWETRTGIGHQILMDQGLYRLNKVNETLEQSPGAWRFAKKGIVRLLRSGLTYLKKMQGSRLHQWKK